MHTIHSHAHGYARQRNRETVRQWDGHTHTNRTHTNRYTLWHTSNAMEWNATQPIVSIWECAACKRSLGLFCCSCVTISIYSQLHNTPPYKLLYREVAIIDGILVQKQIHCRRWRRFGCDYYSIVFIEFISFATRCNFLLLRKKKNEFVVCFWFSIVLVWWGLYT